MVVDSRVTLQMVRDAQTLLFSTKHSEHTLLVHDLLTAQAYRQALAALWEGIDPATQCNAGATPLQTPFFSGGDAGGGSLYRRALKQIPVNAYERNRRTRAACISRAWRELRSLPV